MASQAGDRGDFATHSPVSLSSLGPHSTSPAPSRSTSPPQITHLESTSRTSAYGGHGTSLLPMAMAPAAPGKRKRIVQHFREFRTTRLFLYLTMITLVMVVINMVQIALMHHLNNLVWILGFPTLVLGLMLSALLVWMFVTRRTLLRSWHEAERPARIARIGIVLSVVLPIFCCEFLYLNLVAVPAYHRKVWDTSLQAHNELLAPSFVLAQPLDNILLDVTASCSSIAPRSGPQFGCLGPSQNLPTAIAGGYQARIYDGQKTPYNISTADGLALPFGVTFSEPLPTLATNENLLFAPFDPRLGDDLARALDCGIVRLDIYPVNQSTTVEIFLEQSSIVDNVGALDYPSWSDESCNLQSFSKYNTYSYRLYERGGVPDTQFCTQPVSTSDGPCIFNTVLYMSSMLVTTQTSTRGTDWIKMILDEGSIVGGITFVTWFLGIYII